MSEKWTKIRPWRRQVLKLLRGHFPYIKFSMKGLEEISDRGGGVLFDFVNSEAGIVVVAYLILDTKPDDDVIAAHRDCYYLTYMGTKKAYRRQGRGAALLNEAKEIATANKKPIYTYVASFNTKELNLLMKHGFKVLREVIKYNQNWLELKYEVS